DLGESVENAAIRETREETGVTIRLDSLVGVYSSSERHVVLVVYTGTIVGGEITAGNEVQALGLFDLDQLPDLAFEHDLDIIRDSLDRKATS
ncbi:MAG: NUDIX hydrolase, partial [Dehalococcoidales bacterium]|nr:NUDIX hydrolase [Dehalococcoidales bacterium]